MKFLVLIGLLFFCRGYSQTSIENRVNEHLSKTYHQIEIQKKKRESELIKENLDTKIEPGNSKKPSFQEPSMGSYNESVEPDFKDHFEYEGKDPAQEAQRDISNHQSNEHQKKIERQKFIEEFKRKAMESGVEVEVDPETLKVYPVPKNP